MNRTCQFFIWNWVLLLSITLLLFGSTLTALGVARGDSGSLGFGITFILFGSLLLLTSPCTFLYVGHLCHWMDHFYPGKCCDICEESRGQECQDNDCWINRWPWKCACFCATFSGFTTHLHQHRKGEGCSASDECWIRRLRDACCCGGGPGNNDHPCIQLRLCGRGCLCNCIFESDNMVHPVTPDDVVVSAATNEDCVICMDEPRTMSIVPCGHHATCAACARNLVNREQPCPICRASIDSVIRIYT